MSEHDKLTPLALEGGTYDTRLTRKFALRKAYEKRDPLVIKALIPGAIEKIETAAGTKVRRGETLMILEAMKMHNQIKAPQDGTIKAVRVVTGEKVAKGKILIEIE